MKKTIIKSIYAIVIFLIALLIMDRIQNRESADMTAEMSKATFPLVYVMRDGQRINCMHGMISEMEPAFVCEGITPVDAAARQVDFEMATYDDHINQISYEVRSTDGDRLIENGEIQQFEQTDGKIDFSVSLKDLMLTGQEYILRLVIKDSLSSGLIYDTRLYVMEEAEKADQLIAFALDFSTRSFDKDAAKEITKYLESNEEGDNTTFSKVNIHSSFSQITWGFGCAKKGCLQHLSAADQSLPGGGKAALRAVPG